MALAGTTVFFGLVLIKSYLKSFVNVNQWSTKINNFCMTFIFSLTVYGGHKKHSSRKSSEKNADIFKITNIVPDRKKLY